MLMFLVATLLSGIVVVTLALLGLGTLRGLAVTMLHFLQNLALLLSIVVAVVCPPQFSASRSLVKKQQRRTVRTGIASVGELLAVGLALPAYAGLVLFTEGPYGSTTAGTVGIEPTLLFNGPVSLGLLCVAATVYACSVIIV